jgi:importin subunit beta-1
MQVVCEATQNNAVPVQVGAFECLVKIMSLYYEKMDFYMERALFGVSGHNRGWCGAGAGAGADEIS